ncbi:MAG: hypothetical protein WD185_01890 [Sneathiella sp.]
MNKEVERLLPFYVNGTLQGEEFERVEQAIKADPDLQKEVAFLARLRDEVKTPQAENSPGELGLKRLQNALRQGGRTSDAAASASNVVPLRNWGWRATAIAACLLLVLQTLVMLPAGTDDDLTSAGSGSITIPTGNIISVTFQPDATEENIRNLLLSVGASIVAGPSALGVYKLSVPRDVDAVVTKLLLRRNLVETAQSDGNPAAKP